jgi:hypothetical protein
MADLVSPMTIFGEKVGLWSKAFIHAKSLARHIPRKLSLVGRAQVLR